MQLVTTPPIFYARQGHAGRQLNFASHYEKNTHIINRCYLYSLCIFFIQPLDFLYKYVENINCYMRRHIVMKLPRER